MRVKSKVDAPHNNKQSKRVLLVEHSRVNACVVCKANHLIYSCHKFRQKEEIMFQLLERYSHDQQVQLRILQEVSFKR